MSEDSVNKRRRATINAHAPEFSDAEVVRSTADLGQVVQSVRKRQGLSQQQLSLLTDLHRSYLSEIESGVTTERFDRLFALLDALGLEVVVRRRDLRRGHKPA